MLTWLKNFWREPAAKGLLIFVPLTGVLSLPITWIQDGAIDWLWFYIAFGCTAFYILLAYIFRNWV